MEPGRELDALVAEKVMGYKPNELLENKNNRVFADISIKSIPKYSEDDSAAESVMRKINATASEFHGLGDGSHKVVLKFSGNRTVDAIGNTHAHAICLAALKAVGVK